MRKWRPAMDMEEDLFLLVEHLRIVYASAESAFARH